jgi:magnesium transporter
MSEVTINDRTAAQLKLLSQALDSGRLGPVRRMVNALNPGEIAHLLESLPPGQREIAWGLVDAEVDGEVLIHVNDEVRESLIAAMDTGELIEAASDLDVDDLADIVDDLPDTVLREVLTGMEREDRERLENVLSYPDESAGRLMNADVVTVRADVTIEVVLRYLRMRGDLPKIIDHLFVISRTGEYQGRLAITDVLSRDPEEVVMDILDASLPPYLVTSPAQQVAQDFQTHNWISAPVVDHRNVLVGRITVDDVVDVIREEADHNVLSMAGLNEDEDMFAPVWSKARRRILWLGVNLLTAFLAASVIGHFEATLEKLVALAILMPMVASMGGIAGTQTLTLIVRGLAVGQVNQGNARALLVKELGVGSINGFLFALLIGCAVAAWFQDVKLGAVIAAAILINLSLAALAGVVIPLTLKRMRIDPALAGGVVLTTVTDVMGFFAFLGLGTLLLV